MMRVSLLRRLISSIHESRALVFGVMALVVVTSRSASAGVVTAGISSLGLPHTEQWNDQSFETAAFDGGTVGKLDIGDVLIGVFNMESYGIEGGVGPARKSVGQSASDPVEITGVFAAEVLTKVAVAPIPIVLPFGGWAFSFKPYAPFEATYGTGAMLAAFEDASKNFVSTPVGASFPSALNGLHLATLGFTGAGGTPTAGEGWGALTDSDVFSLLTITSSYSANLNTIISAGFANDVTSSFVIPLSRASAFTAGLFTQFQINGNIFAATAPGPGDFPIRDSADILFTVTSAVPEPGSMLMWAGLAAMVGFGGYRRSRKLAA